ncbi:hypothetical protein MITS9509_01032 [Synechococcus sp. MIT S9509]|nr:hypothetical protein MITS9504_00596 [Synechococcus sp. MIT S9504]KZR92583.1 hypothetical protein MITS9509_01032 [Synechococcus sp. MIT S9509]
MISTIGQTTRGGRLLAVEIFLIVSFTGGPCLERPEELRHLVVKNGTSGSESWLIYQKPMGGTKGQITEPRRLHPLLLRDRPPKAIDW